jgi:calcium-dependent protein kinase
MGAKDSKETNSNEPNENSSSETQSISFTNFISSGLSFKDPSEDYNILHYLNESSFTSVYYVENKHTGYPYAMVKIKKKYTFTFKEEGELINDINNLFLMSHPNIVKIFEFYSSKDSYNIITELCLHGKLYTEVIKRGPFNEKYSAYVMYQVFSAIHYCHKKNIIHRDLNLENILIVKKEKTGFPLIKITDFGITSMFEKGLNQRRIVGNIYYMAPEVINKNYNNKCDLWSCGVVLYILLSGRPPFDGEKDADVFKRILACKYDLTSPPFDTCSNEVKDLIRKLLVIEPYKRLSTEEALNHPWFKINKSKELFNQIKDTSLIRIFIENLKTYKCDSFLQETVLAYFVKIFNQREDIENACKFFNQINENKNGKITHDELVNALKEKLNSISIEKDVDMIFKNLDSDDKGFIESDKCIIAAIKKENFLEEKVLRFAFRFFDKNNSGTTSIKEIRQLFQENKLDEITIQENINKIMEDLNKDEDGIITFEEFTSIMKRMLTY